MWRQWILASSPTTTASDKDKVPKQETETQHHMFRCSSFKDVETICHDPPDNSPAPNLSIHTTPQPTHDTHHCYSPKRHPITPSRRSVFHRVRLATALLRQWPGRLDPPKPKPEVEPEPEPSAEEVRVVVYYTSLRVIRPTFEACRAVQSILQGFRVEIDERDLAMDSGFMAELRELLGGKPTDKLGLPRVFIGGRYIGGADEIRQLHEVGELKKLVSGVPLAKPGTCDTCGGYRFILCAHCCGSRKIYNEKTGVRHCTACNENGLVRCPACLSPSPILPPPRHTIS